jgi:hypothetical protein
MRIFVVVLVVIPMDTRLWTSGLCVLFSSFAVTTYPAPHRLGGVKVEGMIDNVNLKISRQDNPEFTKRLEDLWRRDINTYSGHIQNMGVYQNLDGIIIRGSLAKFLNGENMTPLTREQVEQSIKKLEIETGLDLSKAIVRGIEFGISIITKEKPSEYLKLFGYPAVFTRREYAKPKGVETVTYTTSSGSFEFSGYNKTQEMIQKRQQIPALFQGSNVFRLEYKITKRKGIKAKFGRDLTAYELFDEHIYQDLQDLFLEAYKAIPKFGRQCFFNTAENITPKEWTELLAEQYRQAFPKETLYLQQALRESGALSDKNRERIRAAERRRGKDYSISDKSLLIAELDAHVMNIMRDNISPAPLPVQSGVFP